MAGDLKAADAFDNLAQNIGEKLDYPDVLAEEGIEGTTSVDLYFDSRGLIDEDRSEVLGDHASLRGEMVRAVRSGLLSWYESAATRLRMDEFRNQHFRADFTLSYSENSQERTDKLASGSYHFLRRRKIDICIYPGAIDLACTAAKIAGFIADHTSDKHKVHVAAVLDVLNDFDAQGLRGIDDDIAAQIKRGRVSLLFKPTRPASASVLRSELHGNEHDRKGEDRDPAGCIEQIFRQFGIGFGRAVWNPPTRVGASHDVAC